MNFMRFIAQELREYMAKLGVRTVDELVGRSDLLKVRDRLDRSRHANTGSEAAFWRIRLQAQRIK